MFAEPGRLISKASRASRPKSPKSPHRRRNPKAAPLPPPPPAPPFPPCLLQLSLVQSTIVCATKGLKHTSEVAAEERLFDLRCLSLHFQASEDSFFPLIAGNYVHWRGYFGSFTDGLQLLKGLVRKTLATTLAKSCCSRHLLRPKPPQAIAWKHDYICSRLALALAICCSLCGTCLAKTQSLSGWTNNGVLEATVIDGAQGVEIFFLPSYFWALASLLS